MSNCDSDMNNLLGKVILPENYIWIANALFDAAEFSIILHGNFLKQAPLMQIRSI